MEAKGKFMNVIKAEENEEQKRVVKVSELTFRPSLFQRVMGKKDQKIRIEIDSSPLKKK
jgi:hypothetical protein